MRTTHTVIYSSRCKVTVNTHMHMVDTRSVAPNQSIRALRFKKGYRVVIVHFDIHCISVRHRCKSLLLLASCLDFPILRAVSQIHLFLHRTKEQT